MALPNQRLYKTEESLSLTLGGRLDGFQIAYETWGTLNKNADNAIVIFPGLSASAHAKSHDREDVHGWWEAIIGPGLGIDTNRFFVICMNHLGGCFGSTGPSSENPATGKPYALKFPPVLLQDLVDAAHRVVRSLGIQRLYGVVGTSMGGMLSMEFAARYADDVGRMVMISGSGRPGSQSIAFRYVQRQVILNDPAFNDGNYYDHEDKPTKAMAVARQIGNITYRSFEEMNQRFGRTRTNVGYNFGPDFQVESYLQHMGDKLSRNFDPNSFLYLTKAMDYYSLGYGFPSYESGVLRIKARAMIIGVTSDMLFPINEQESVYKILKKDGRDVTYKRLDSIFGHDAFLVEVDFFKDALSSFLSK